MASVQKDVEVIVIDPIGDLILRMYTTTKVEGEYFNSAKNCQPTEGKILKEMKVSRKVMIDNSTFFKSMLTKNWSEKAQEVVDIEISETSDVHSAELWFRVFHGNDLPSDLYKLPIKVVWEVIQYAGFLQGASSTQADLTKLRPWFAGLLELKDINKLSHKELRMLLYPCYVFDHAKGFATMTKRLAYEVSDHITEENPTGHRRLHVDGNVIGSVNGAKGSLRMKLLRGLFDPIGAFLRAECDCKEMSLFAYNVGLSKTGIWPLHDHAKKSVDQILTSPGFLKFQCQIPTNACIDCTSSLSENAIEGVRLEIANDFDGLCLDCMKLTDSGDVDEDYWTHDLQKNWSDGCRIYHKQPTWYFSFMGRKTDMKNYQQKKKKKYERRKTGYSWF